MRPAHVGPNKLPTNHYSKHTGTHEDTIETLRDRFLSLASVAIFDMFVPSRRRSRHDASAHACMHSSRAGFNLSESSPPIPPATSPPFSSTSDLEEPGQAGVSSSTTGCLSRIPFYFPKKRNSYPARSRKMEKDSSALESWDFLYMGCIQNQSSIFRT